MKISSFIKRLVSKKTVLGVAALAVVASAAVAISTKSVNAASVYDCDTNAVVYCGAPSSASLISKYKSGDGHNSAASIDSIYDSAPFNITSADVSGMNGLPINGSVNKDGDVYLGNTLVATGAVTAGRLDIDGSASTPHHTSNGTLYYTRTPSVSFLNSSLSAYVVMKDNKFDYAILTSCGNPVAATPITPTYSINKAVRPAGSQNFVKVTTVKAQGVAQYQITVVAGSLPLTGVVVRDALPAHETYVAGSLEENGTPISTSGAFFGGGITLSLAARQEVIFTYSAVVGPSDTALACSAQGLTNEAYMIAPGLPLSGSASLVNEQCPPVPSGMCTTLTATPGNNDMTFNFTVKSSVVNGATVKGYVINFDDGTAEQINTSALSASYSHTYTTAKSYTAFATAIFDLDGTTKDVTSKGCEVAVSPTTPQIPTPICTGLTATAETANPFAYGISATYSPTNVDLTGASIDWGDNTTTNGVAGTAGTITAGPHTYATAGTYIITATLSFSSTAGAVPDAKCSAAVTINGPQPVFTCNELGITEGGDRTVTISGVSTTPASGTTTNGVTYNSVDINWGDGNTVTGLVDATNQTHQYASDGSYTITAEVHFTVDGQTVPAVTSLNCSQPVSFTTPTTPTPTVTPPAALVNTGPGNIFGLFAGVSALGALAYRWILRRRLDSTN